MVNIEINMESNELMPLEVNQQQRPRLKTNRQTSRYSAECYRAPLRVVRLVLLLVLLPCVFIVVPLYMRYRVFQSQMYPMGMTDMRLIDGRISPTWCQRQVVKSNSTFNAFVVPGAPSIADDLVPVSMVRELQLEDDMKEYWGFYLLQGSTVTVAACVRRPGASLIMIKGYKHLKDCAYIGDDSSEEVDELFKLFSIGKISEKLYKEELIRLQPNKEGAKANSPGTMKRHKEGVSFLDPSQSSDVTLSKNNEANGDVTDHDPKELKDILERLHAARQALKDEKAKYYHPPDNIMAVPELHRYRDTNVDKNERQWLSFKDIDGNSTEINKIHDEKINNATEFDAVTTRIDKIEKTNENRSDAIEKINIDEIKNVKEDETNDFETIPFSELLRIEEDDKEPEIRIKEEVSKETEVVDEVKENKTEINEIIVEDKTKDIVYDIKENEERFGDNIDGAKESSEINSKEVFEEVLNRLQSLGDKGKRVLKKLQETMGTDEQPPLKTLSKNSIISKLTGSDEELERLKKVLIEAIDEEMNKAQRQEKRRKANEDARKKREIYLQRSLNEDDEGRNVAAEEGLDLEPDGYAEHHTRLNESTTLDMSRSEFWSSFSSSEERLLECEGLILNLPLSPSISCEAGKSEEERLQAAQKNAVTYRVPANGYYFFVFNSENEKEINYISVRFDLQKTRYDIARTALRECRNSTEPCSLILDIFSSQKVVLELPLRDNSSLWNEQWVVVSECEPRTSIYLVCALAVPVLIIVFAFQ